MSFASIDLRLRDLLKDPARRRAFFEAITQDEVASQIRSLRKRRGLTQSDLATSTGMKQSAVSRIEQADYASWNVNTLFKVAAGLSGRWRMILEPAEDAMREYERFDAENAAYELISETAEGSDEAAPFTITAATADDGNINLGKMTARDEDMIDIFMPGLSGSGTVLNG